MSAFGGSIRPREAEKEALIERGYNRKSVSQECLHESRSRWAPNADASTSLNRRNSFVRWCCLAPGT